MASRLHQPHQLLQDEERVVLLDVLEAGDGVHVVERVVVERYPQPVVHDVAGARVAPSLLRGLDHHRRHVEADDLTDRVPREHRLHDPADTRTELEHPRAVAGAGVGEQRLEAEVAALGRPFREPFDRHAVVNAPVQLVEAARFQPRRSCRPPNPIRCPRGRISVPRWYDAGGSGLLELQSDLWLDQPDAHERIADRRARGDVTR